MTLTDSPLPFLIQLAQQECRSAGTREGGNAMIRLVDALLRAAAARQASDLHIEPQMDGIHLRCRIDGLLAEPLPLLPLTLQAALLARVKLMAGMDVTGHQLPQDGHIACLGDGTATDIRVSSLPASHGEVLVLRFQRRDEKLLELDSLGFTAENLTRFRGFIRRQAGLVIITGPMNSGKSTTLYAAIHALTAPETSIVTLEDPIERQLPGICQVQMRERTGLTYPVALRALLRQDAEKILLGEIRDEETAALAVRIALTGHLLLTTLHTDDCVDAIFRLREMGVPAYLLAAVLTGIVSQRLVRRLCPACREAYTIPADSAEAQALGKDYQAGMKLWRARGCDACQGTGSRGRLALHELLPLTPALRQLILQGAPADALRTAMQKAALPTLWQDGLSKCQQGLTSLAELQRVLG